MREMVGRLRTVLIDEQPSSRKLVNLQMLRAWAAALVIVDHGLSPVTAWHLAPAWFDNFRWNFGALGVGTFFVISGFIMAHTTRRDFGEPHNAVAFLIKRAIRVVPMYWIATLLSYRPRFSLVELVKSLTFVPYAQQAGAPMRPILGQGWTLTYEMFFYAFFGVAILFPRRFGLAFIFSVFVALVAIGFFLPADLDMTGQGGVIFALTRPYLLLFLVGVGLGLLKQSSIPMPTIPHPFVWIGVAFTATLAFALAINAPDEKPFGLQMLFWIPAVFAVFACVNSSDPPSRPSNELLVRLGDASYSTYLFHAFLLLVLAKLFGYLPHNVGTAALLLLAMLIGGHIIGWCAHRIVERPTTAYLTAAASRFFKLDRKPAASTEPVSVTP